MKEYRMDEIVYNGSGLKIMNVEPSYNIHICNLNGKKLILDFNTDKLIVSGDLEYDEAAKLFFDSLNYYFGGVIDKQVKEKLKEI